MKVAQHEVLGFRFIAKQVPQGRLKITQDIVLGEPVWHANADWR